MPKVKDKHLIFKASIIGIKTHLLVDNSSEAKLINKFFVCTNKLSTLKLEKYINLILRNDKIENLLKNPLLN